MNRLHWVARFAAIAIAAAGMNAHAGDQPQPASPQKAKPVYVCQMGDGLKEYDKPGICPEDGMALVVQTIRLRIAVLVFDGVEEIDYAGPIEVFGASGAKVFTIGPSLEVVRSAYGLKVQPDYDFEHAPAADVFVVPGGSIGAVLHNPKLMAWLRQRSAESRMTMSVCTGAFILGKAGLLDGLAATTVAPGLSQLATQFPKVHVLRDRRYADNGAIISTAGLSAGIDGALHVIEREQGRMRAQAVARAIEYEWQPDGKSSFGTLASVNIPDINDILPSGATWEQLVDHGNAQQWDRRGKVEAALSAAEFLAEATQKMQKQGWSVQGSGPLRRSFVLADAGQQWLLTISLRNDATPSTFRLSMLMRKAAPAKGKG